MRNLKFFLVPLFAAALFGCGGGGGNPGGVNGGTGTVTPARVEVLTSGQLATSASSSVTITAQVVDASNNAMSGKTVTFSSDSGVLSGASATTSASGVATVTLSTGADKSNRNITVTAVSGSVSGNVTVAVTGSSLTVSGGGALLVGSSPAKYIVQARDAANVGIGGQKLSLTSTLGNTLTPTEVTTDTSGNASFTLTPSKAGSDTLTATAFGATASISVSVSATNFTVVAPSPDANIDVGVGQPFSVQYLLNGAPAVGQKVLFSATRGVLSADNALTGADGRATVTINSVDAGPASLSASVAGAVVSTKVLFVARNPATIKLQASQTAVLPNVSGKTTNQASLVATVRDATGNFVAGVPVTFNTVVDPSGGSISFPSVMTDANGQATSAFIAGASSTGTGGVDIAATVSNLAGSKITSNTKITVSGQSLFLHIAYGNTISKDASQTRYEKKFSLYVTDSNGAAVTDQVVTISVYPTRYGKGRLVWGGSTWTYGSGYPTVCSNEDVLKNGILTDGNDINGNGKLEPGEPIVISPGQVKTDASGFANFLVSYGQQYADWLYDIELTVTGVVAGTESKNTTTLPSLWGMASDYSNANIAPAAINSPFGHATSCSDPS